MEPKITFYVLRDFKGRSKDFTKSCPDLLDAGIDDTTTCGWSVKCTGGVWILYSEKDYKGYIFVVEDGDQHNSILFGETHNPSDYFATCGALSLKLLDYKDFTEEPKCTVYQDCFSGQSLTFTDDVQNLEHHNFDKQVSSIEVQSGAWVGYTAPVYKGEQTLFRKGFYKMSDGLPRDNGGFCNDSLHSFSKIVLKPAGKIKLKSIDYDLKKSKIQNTSSTVFSWAQENNTSVEQTLTKTDVPTERDDTYEFRWDKASKIPATLKAKVSIPCNGSAGVSLSPEMLVSMGRTAGTQTSKTDKWFGEYFSKIPQYSTVTVTSTLTEGKTNMPFTAILYYGDDTEHTFVEKGVFYGCNFFDFHTEFNETKLPKPT